MMKRCWISWASPGFCSVTHLTDSVTLTVLYVREPMHLWVTLQHFATVMPHIGEWATHPFSRHILTHSPSGWLHQPLFVSWLREEWRVKKRLTLVEHRISAASGYREQPASLLLAEEPRGGVSWLSCSIVAQQLFFPLFIYLSAHHPSLHHFSLSLLQISAHLSQYRLEVGGFPVSKRIMTFHWFIDDMIQTCNVTNMPCCRMILFGLNICLYQQLIDFIVCKKDNNWCYLDNVSWMWLKSFRSEILTELFMWTLNKVM